MKNKPASLEKPVPLDIRVPAPAAGWRAKWNAFWFTPTDPTGLHVLRVVAGLVFLAWLLPLAGHVDAFYGLQGWMDRDAYFQAHPIRDRLPISNYWSILFLVASNSTMLHVTFWFAAVSIAAFTLGFATRITGVLTWLFMISFAANPAMPCDADYLLGILAFYLMIGYLFHGFMGGQLSNLEKVIGSAKQFLPARFFGKASVAPPSPPGGEGRVRGSVAANVVLRLVQIHLALIIVTSALHKLQFGDWWSGVALWYPLHPAFEITEATFTRLRPHAEGYVFLLSLAGYAVLAWQLSFPLWAWKRAGRYLLLPGLAVGWLGTAFIYDLPFMGPFFFAAGLSFVTPEQWHRLGSMITGPKRLRRDIPQLEKKAPAAARA